jgi:putative glutamine amidotransferase
MVVTAMTPDGVIEAIEHKTQPILGVQWHPERMICEEESELPNMLPLFQHFIELCKK